ncbi:MAG: hexose kinase [Solobacterium sp.]|nr:hexose kinase [Solobacterium sp.]
MIYTLTLNPAIDYYMEIQGDLKEDGVNRAKNELFKPAGKGLNVSRDLSIMKIPSVAVAVLGGFTGQFIEQQVKGNRYIDLRAVRVEGNNRVNVKMHDHGTLIAVNGEGPCADERVCEEIRNVLAEAGENDTCVIAGSMMKGFDAEFIVSLCDSLHQRGVQVVLDTEKLSLETLSRCHPDMVKRTLAELAALLGEEADESRVVEYLQRAKDAGLHGILLPLGEKGCYLMCRDAMYRMSYVKAEPVNKVGTGDAMLAAFLGKVTDGLAREDALRWAGALAGAVSATLAEVTLDDVLELFDDITVSVIG